MFDRETLRGILSMGFLIGVCGGTMAFVQPPGSAEFVLSVCSAVMGAAVVGVAVVVSRIGRR
jgi:hypothetical protein